MTNPLAADLDCILASTSELWEEMRSQRLFITGGTGFVGRWLLESFAWANDQLGLNATAVVLSRNLEPRTLPPIKRFNCSREMFVSLSFLKGIFRM